MKDKLKEVADHMDLGRTEELFDITIRRADFKSKDPFNGDEDIRKAGLVVKMGNVHINTAKTKISAIRMIGYIDNTRKLTLAVKRRTRRAIRGK